MHSFSSLLPHWVQNPNQPLKQPHKLNLLLYPQILHFYWVSRQPAFFVFVQLEPLQDLSLATLGRKGRPHRLYLIERSLGDFRLAWRMAYQLYWKRMGKQVVAGLYVGLLFDVRELLKDDEPAKNVNEKYPLKNFVHMEEIICWACVTSYKIYFSFKSFGNMRKLQLQKGR